METYLYFAENLGADGTDRQNGDATEGHTTDVLGKKRSRSEANENKATVDSGDLPDSKKSKTT